MCSYPSPRVRVDLGSLLPFQGLTCWAGAKHSPPSAPLAPSLQPKGSRDDPKHRGPCPSFLSTKTLWVGRHNSCFRAFHRSAIIPTVLYGAAFIRLSTTEVWGHILSPVRLPRAGCILQAHGTSSYTARRTWELLRAGQAPDVQTSPSSCHAALESRLPADMGLLLRQLAN